MPGTDIPGTEKLLAWPETDPMSPPNNPDLRPDYSGSTKLTPRLEKRDDAPIQRDPRDSTLRKGPAAGKGGRISDTSTSTSTYHDVGP